MYLRLVFFLNSVYYLLLWLFTDNRDIQDTVQIINYSQSLQTKRMENLKSCRESSWIFADPKNYF